MRAVIYGPAEPCQACRLTEGVFARAQLEFEKRIATDKDRERFETLGFRSFPVVENGEDIWAGFNPARIKALVERVKGK